MNSASIRNCSVRLFAFVFSLVVASAAVGQANVTAVLQSPQERKAAPSFTLQDSAGKTVSLESFRGRVVLLDFWATWCHGCKKEIPYFSDFERKYAGKGLTVIGVSQDSDGWKVVKPFIRKASIPYRIVLGNDAMAQKYGIENMPVTFLIDRRGRIAATYVGVVDRGDIQANLQAVLFQP